MGPGHICPGSQEPQAGQNWWKYRDNSRSALPGDLAVHFLFLGKCVRNLHRGTSSGFWVYFPSGDSCHMVAASSSPWELLFLSRTTSSGWPPPHCWAHVLAGQQRVSGWCLRTLNIRPKGRHVRPPPAPSITWPQSRCSVGMFWMGTAFPTVCR